MNVKRIYYGCMVDYWHASLAASNDVYKICFTIPGKQTRQTILLQSDLADIKAEFWKS